MRVLCYSVRLESLTAISDNCFKARGFNGSEDLIPASQFYGPDYEVIKSEAYWISAWILEKKNLQYSQKKKAWFDKDTRKKLPNVTIETHIPEKVSDPKTNPDDSLIRGTE